MLYEDLHRRFGSHVSQRVKRELSEAEFNQITVEKLSDFLMSRAEASHRDYQNLLNNPLVASMVDERRTKQASRRWREAEDLAYLVAVAEDVNANARAS